MLSRENVTREALSALEAQRAANLTEEKRRRAEVEEKLKASGFEICGVFGNTNFKRTSKTDSKFYFAARAIK